MTISFPVKSNINDDMAPLELDRENLYTSINFSDNPQLNFSSWKMYLKNKSFELSIYHNSFIILKLYNCHGQVSGLKKDINEIFKYLRKNLSMYMYMYFEEQIISNL